MLSHICDSMSRYLGQFIPPRITDLLYAVDVHLHTECPVHTDAESHFHTVVGCNYSLQNNEAEGVGNLK